MIPENEVTTETSNQLINRYRKFTLPPSDLHPRRVNTLYSVHRELSHPVIMICAGGTGRLSCVSAKLPLLFPGLYTRLLILAQTQPGWHVGGPTASGIANCTAKVSVALVGSLWRRGLIDH